jgi:hypothetical protein
LNAETSSEYGMVLEDFRSGQCTGKNLGELPSCMSAMELSHGRLTGYLQTTAGKHYFRFAGNSRLTSATRACGVPSKLRAAVDPALSIEARTFRTHGT